MVTCTERWRRHMLTVGSSPRALGPNESPSSGTMDDAYFYYLNKQTNHLNKSRHGTSAYRHGCRCEIYQCLTMRARKRFELLQLSGGWREPVDGDIVRKYVSELLTAEMLATEIE